MTLTIWWSPESRADLDQIDEYFADKNPAYADQVGDLALAAARFLAENPYSGAMVERTRQRKWRVVRTRYILLYRPDGDILRITRVLHTARNWQPFL